MKITRIDKLTEERWLNLFVASYENRGHVGRWVFVSRRAVPHVDASADAVVIVPILRNPGEPARLVLLHEFRIPAGGWLYGLPAGLLEPGESIDEAVRREMREETGLELVAIKRLSPSLFSSSGLTDEAAVVAFVEVTGQPGAAQDLEPSEVIEVVLADHAEVCRLVNDPTLRCDAKVWLIMSMYAQLGRLE